MEKIDWMIDYDFLDIEYFGKLSMIVFTERGWKIESHQRADEFLEECQRCIKEEKPIPDMEYLKDRDRKMILLVLDKIRETGDSKYIPYLKAWEKLDYKKVKAEIHATIKAIESDEAIDLTAVQNRNEEIQEAL